MPIFTNQIGLSINQNKIQLVEIVNKEESFCLENVDEEYFEEIINESTKEAKFIHILQNAFNEIILRKPLTSSKVSIALSPSFFNIFEVPVDKNLTKNDLNDYINWEISKLFPNKKSDYFSHQKVISSSLNIHEIKKVIVFAISKDLLKRIHKFCVRNSLQLKFIDNGQIASAMLLESEVEIKKYISIYLEDNLLSTILYSDKQIICHKVNQFSSVSEIPELINDFHTYIKTRKLYSGEVKKVLLDGQFVTKELKKSIENSTDFELLEISPFSKIKISSALEKNKFITDVPAKFSSTTAIALRIAS